MSLRAKVPLLVTLVLLAVVLVGFLANRQFELSRELHGVARPVKRIVTVDTRAHGPERDLKLVLERVAINKEVLACVSNAALITADGSSGMLKLWLDGVRHAKVKNYMVIAIDDELANILDRLKVPYWRKDPQRTADSANSNHGISALKFQLIKEFLELDHSVLLSDVDILTLQNPFRHLYRDEDLEALSDGFDKQTAYGYDHVFDDPQMGWSRYAHSVRIFALNSGLFYARPNPRTLQLMDRITTRLMKEKLWDQAVFNEEIWFPSHDDYKASHVTVRVMNIYKFVNSKTLFRTLRHDAQYQQVTPVMVHANYHPDKYERLLAVWDRYVNGNLQALDRYPVGSCIKCPAR